MPSGLTLFLVASLNLVALCTLGLLAWTRHAVARAASARLAAMEREMEALHSTAASAEVRTRLIDGVLAALPDGVSIFDAELRLVCWNSRFAESSGVPQRALRIGAPLAELLRLQAEAGEFGLVDPEDEVERRMAQLRDGPVVARTRRERPDGSIIELRRAALPGGGFVTLYTPLAVNAEIVLAPDLAAAFRAEWDLRLPRLTAAAADGDAPAAQAVAHALRGIAANAGWTALALTLASIESAAAAGDLREVRSLTALLPLEPDA